jgi:glycosyltransferase involved in cell wall biosynthesis
MNQQKRHDRLLEAFSLSHFAGKLVLLGQGSDEAQRELAAQAKQWGIAERVMFVGFCANPYAYMRAAKALVLSSDYEGFGNVLVEALICGTPVVSTDCPYGPDEIMVGDLARGLCALTPAALAEAITQTLAHPPHIDENNLQRFSLDNAVDRYLALAGQ